MADATPLSSAAQAVMEAFTEASDGHYLNGEWIQDYAGQIAAALRAAADQVQHHWDGMECVDHLQAIAAELEGTTRDPLEPNDLSQLSEEEFQALAPQGYHGV